MTDDTELAFLRHDLTKALREVEALRDRARRLTTSDSTVWHGLTQATVQLEGALAGLEEWL